MLICFIRLAKETRWEERKILISQTQESHKNMKLQEVTKAGSFKIFQTKKQLMCEELKLNKEIWVWDRKE